MNLFHLNYLLKAPSPNMVTLNGRASIYEFGAITQSIAQGNFSAIKYTRKYPIHFHFLEETVK